MSAWPGYVDKQDSIVLFDGVCVLCTGWVKFLLKYDTKPNYKLVSVQSPAGQDLLRYADMPIEFFETLVVIEQGVVHVRSNAVLHVLLSLGFPWSISAIFKIIPRRLRDITYHYIAINRYCLFGKREFCYLPSPLDQQRFLTKPAEPHV